MDLRAALATHRLVAIIRGTDPEAAVRTVLTLAEEGVELIEVSLTGTDALSVIERARRELGPDRPLGAGTVLTAEDARAAHRAGANFAVTRRSGTASMRRTGSNCPCWPGCSPPPRSSPPAPYGVAALKIFPAAEAGGPAYLKALRGPFPHEVFVPVGGVDAVAAREYLNAGATAVGVGSPLVGDAADGGSLTALRDRTRALLAVVGDASPVRVVS